MGEGVVTLRNNIRVMSYPRLGSSRVHHREDEILEEIRVGDWLVACLADGDDLHGEGVLVVVGGTVDVVAHQLLVTAIANRNHAAEEVDELHGMLPVAKEEVDTLRSHVTESITNHQRQVPFQKYRLTNL